MAVAKLVGRSGCIPHALADGGAGGGRDRVWCHYIADQGLFGLPSSYEDLGEVCRERQERKAGKSRTPRNVPDVQLQAPSQRNGVEAQQKLRHALQISVHAGFAQSRSVKMPASDRRRARIK